MQVFHITVNILPYTKGIHQYNSFLVTFFSLSLVTVHDSEILFCIETAFMFSVKFPSGLSPLEIDGKKRNLGRFEKSFVFTWFTFPTTVNGKK